MRRMWSALAMCGLVAWLAACGAEAPEKGVETQPAAAEQPAEPAEPSAGNFEAGDTRGWDTAQGDPTRTDFESGDTGAWSDTKGKVKAAEPDDGGQTEKLDDGG